MRRLISGDATQFEAIRQCADAIGHILRDRFGCQVRLQGLGVREQPAQDVEILGVCQSIQVEGVYGLDGPSKVRVNLEPVHVAHDQQRGIFEILSVLEQLIVCGFQIATFLFVFPAKVALHPHIGPAVATAGFTHASFERVPRSLGVGVDRFRLTE